METKEQKTFTFKTNINCAGCVAKIEPVLNTTASINEWSVDTAHADKILSVSTDSLSSQEIMTIVLGIGFNIQVINN